MRFALICLASMSLVACDAAPQLEGALVEDEVAPPPFPGALELTVGQVFAGNPSRMTARSAARGTDIFFILSRRGPGQTCPPQLGGGCVDLQGPLTVLGSARTNAAGFAELQLRTPPGLADGIPMWVQAVARDPAGLRKSPVVEQTTGGIMCPLFFSPVCGIDGQTYGNECELGASGTFLDHAGPC